MYECKVKLILNAVLEDLTYLETQDTRGCLGLCKYKEQSRYRISYSAGTFMTRKKNKYVAAHKMRI